MVKPSFISHFDFGVWSRYDDGVSFDLANEVVICEQTDLSAVATVRVSSATV